MTSINDTVPVAVFVRGAWRRIGEIPLGLARELAALTDQVEAARRAVQAIGADYLELLPDAHVTLHEPPEEPAPFSRAWWRRLPWRSR